MSRRRYLLTAMVRWRPHPTPAFNSILLVATCNRAFNKYCVTSASTFIYLTGINQLIQRGLKPAIGCSICALRLLRDGIRASKHGPGKAPDTNISKGFWLKKNRLIEQPIIKVMAMPASSCKKSCTASK